MNDLRGKVYEFGPFRLDADERLLWRDGQLLTLAPKEFDTLLVLVENSGHLVGKEAIISRVWPETFVGDSSLTRNISVLRATLGDGVIQTVPKFGYRLTLAARPAPPAPEPASGAAPPVEAAFRRASDSTPSTALTPTFIIQNTEMANKAMDVDAFRFSIAVTR